MPMKQKIILSSLMNITQWQFGHNQSKMPIIDYIIVLAAVFLSLTKAQTLWVQILPYYTEI